MDPPEKILWDDQERLHCLDGPAVRYGDGSEFYAIHEIAVPEKYIKTPPEEIDLLEVLGERNAEVRLAVISRVGFRRLLDTQRYWVISSAGGNSLIEFRLGTTERNTQFVRALHLNWQDKTGQKETLIWVPRERTEFGDDCPDDIDDCEQVRRWTLGWPKEAIAVAET